MRVQDQGTTHPRARLALVLALLRVLAGPRGHSTATWHAGGFRYVLHVTRAPRESGSVVLDVDTDALDALDVAQRLSELLEEQH